MGSENYKLLMEEVKIDDEVAKLEKVNKHIDEIISKSSDKMQVLESLICMFEAQINVGPYFSSVAIAYAVLIGAVAISPEDWIRIFVMVLLLIMSIVLAVMSIQTNRNIKHKTFVLQALRFRYEKEMTNSNTVTNGEG